MAAVPPPPLRIPRLLHQTCRDKGALPPEILANIEHLRALNPGWDYRLYDNAEAADFVRTHYDAEVLAAFHKINPKYGAAVADLFRYLLVHEVGGVYLDLKSTLRRPLDEVLRPDDQFLLAQWHNRLGEEFQGWGFHADLAGIPGGEFQQWHVAAAPRHPFLAHAINRALFNIRTYEAGFHGTGHLGVMRTTGPVCYTLAIAPHLARAPFRIVDTRELGFRYTIYEASPHAHHTVLFEEHYTRLAEPVVL